MAQSGSSKKDESGAQNASAAGDEIFLVDGSGYIFRAYYALPQNLTNPEGTPVGAVLGFSNMLHKLLNDLRAPYIAVIFDAARRNFRYDIYADYKANREEAPADLVPQFPLFREATEAFGIPALELEGFEADDLIATYARLAKEQGRKVTIVGTDKDLMQLVDDDVRLYDPIKGRYLETSDVFEKFGVAPDRVADVQALAGDPTDNVPGVPGIGVKTAAQLITEFGDLEALLAKAETIKQPKRREALIANAENARISKRLVTLDAHVAVPLALEDLRSHDPDSAQLSAFLSKQGFKSLLARIGGTVIIPDMPGPAPAQTATSSNTMATGAPALPPTDSNRYILINDMDALKTWIARAKSAGRLCIDTETTGLTPARADLVGIALAIDLGEGAYVPVGHEGPRDLLGGAADETPQLKLADVLAALKPVLEDDAVLKIGHNIKYDVQMFAKHGVNLHPCDDTMLLSYTLDGTAHGHGMDELSLLFCGHDTIKYADVTGTGKKQIGFAQVPVSKALDYAAEDAEITLRLHHILKPRVAREQMAAVYEDIERPLIPVIAGMELAGIKVDRAVLHRMSQDFGHRLLALEADIHKEANGSFNVGSPRQVGVVLFEQMGLQGGRKTKTGDWSTSVDVLEDLAESGPPIVQKILDWRQLSKLKSTYTDALQEQINPATGRVHTSFQMAGTSTGRLSSSDPNLQNIPIRTEEGRAIRHAFVAEEGHVLLSVDYSQVELRLAAELAGVEALKQAFRDGTDIHRLTAAQVFGVALDDVTPELRRQAKAVNFGIIYGISGWGLGKQLGIGANEANEFIRRYLSRFGEIRDYMEAKKEEARRHGYVKTLYGRKCIIPGINDKNPARRGGAERQAINAPLQGTAADIMKRAMIRMGPSLDRAGLKARMLLQVHDELVFEVPESEIEPTAALIKQVMETTATLGVPLEAEAGWGKSWGAAH